MEFARHSPLHGKPGQVVTCHFERSELVRGLGVWSAASVVAGTVIGSGIFLVTSNMTQGVGRPAWVLFVWVFGGLLSLAGALAYAELGAMMPEAGGEYVYLRQAYGPLWGFLYGWSQFLVMKTASVATLAAGFALYFAFFFPSLNLKLAAVGVIAVLGVVNYFGVRASGSVQIVFTLLKIGLILALAASALLLGGGNWANLRTSVPVHSPISGFVVALVAALWAYDGWNNICMAGGEVADPRKNIPRALLLGTATVVGLYLLANIAYFYVLPAGEVGASPRVAGDAAQRFLGQWGGRAVAVAAMTSIFAALNGSILSGSRVPFAMARDRLFFGPLAAVHPRFHSPHIAVLAQCAAGALMALTGRYSELFTYVVFASWIYYGLTAAAVFVLRRKHPEWPRPYRTWGYPVLPALFVAISGWLVVMTLREQAWWRSLLGLGIIGLGLPAYFLFRKHARGTVAAALVALLLLPAVARAGELPLLSGSGELQFATLPLPAGSGELQFATLPLPAGSGELQFATLPLPAGSGELQFATRSRTSTHGELKFAATGARHSPQRQTKSAREVLLFALNDDAAIESLRAHGSSATTISPQWFTVSADGRIGGAPSAALLEACRSLRLPLTPAVVNRDFSPDVAAGLLASPRARRRAASELLAKARQFGFRGYIVDFEGLAPQPQQKQQFVRFLRELRAAFSKPRLSLAVAVPSPSPRQREAYDYAAIGKLADRVVLMAYDQHSRLGAPGPIAGYPWVQTSLQETLALVPAGKLLLGIAFYHRDWSEIAATSGSYNDAVALQREHQSELRWDQSDRAHWFSYFSGGQAHTVWMEDAESLSEKLALARRSNLAGVAGWRLGQEDQRIWLLLPQFRRE